MSILLKDSHYLSEKKCQAKPGGCIALFRHCCFCNRMAAIQPSGSISDTFRQTLHAAARFCLRLLIMRGGCMGSLSYRSLCNRMAVQLRTCQYQFVSVSTNSYLSVPIRTCQYQFVPVSPNSYLSVPIRACQYQFAPVSANSYLSVPIPTCQYQFPPVSTNSYLSIPIRTC